MQELNWIDINFEFNFPVEAFPNIIERLRGTPARLEELVRSLPPAILTQRPDDGGDWSIQEHVGHLYDLDELHEGRLQDYNAGLDVLRAADMQNKKTYDADHNANTIENLLDAFRSARTTFVREMEAMDFDAAGRTAIHPRLKKQMRVVDMAYFVAEHDDHHLASITRLVRRFTAG
jgi:uncharacterized damage-inducible protein DinB